MIIIITIPNPHPFTKYVCVYVCLNLCFLNFNYEDSFKIRSLCTLMCITFKIM
jgi:hypothetical protein